MLSYDPSQSGVSRIVEGEVVQAESYRQFRSADYDDPPRPPQIPEAVLRQGIPAVMAHLFPETYMLIQEIPTVGFETALRRLTHYIEEEVLYQRLIQLQLGYALHWIKRFRLWEKALGEAAYDDFRQWTEVQFPNVNWTDIQLWMNFYETFCALIEQGADPQPLLLPGILSFPKVEQVRKQLEAVRGELKQQREQLPLETYVALLDERNAQLSQTAAQIMTMPEAEFRQTLVKRSYHPLIAEPVLLYLRCRYQPSSHTMVVYDCQFALSEKTWNCILTHNIQRRWFVDGETRAMTDRELEAWFDAKDLLISEEEQEPTRENDTRETEDVDL